MPETVRSYIGNLKKEIEPHADPEYAVQMKAYLRNQFEFLGMKSPERKVLFKEFFNSHGLPGLGHLETVVEELFRLEHREYHYFAIELAAKFRSRWTAEHLSLFETMAVTRSWWDTVDHIRNVCLKDYFLMFPKGRYPITGRWLASGNIWLQRLSVTFQLGYKEKTDTRLLKRNILRLKDSDEFFIQKAIGWALRDYAKTDPDFVKGFVSESGLKPLSRREALKRLK